MAFRGLSPLKWSRDVSEGYINISVAILRKFQPHELKQAIVALQTVQREIRQVIPEEQDYDTARKKNFRTQNVNRALLVIQNFIKHRRIHI